MHSAPFWRTADKIGFMVGVTIMLSFVYLIAKFPHDLFYQYYSVLMPTLILLRMGHYYHLKWHYYISDFCYYANFLVLYLLLWNSRSEQLVKICFLFSNGCLGMSIYLFRNSLVFHKIDMMTSLGIHFIPMATMYHIKWYTIQEQANLPAE